MRGGSWGARAAPRPPITARHHFINTAEQVVPPNTSNNASALPASAVPTVLERFPGCVRCVMDIAPEVVGWVIGRSGAHIKEMKVCCLPMYITYATWYFAKCMQLLFFVVR